MTMHKIQISDNCYPGKLLQDCIESENKDIESVAQIAKDISIFSGRQLDQLIQENSNLLVFPQNINAFNDEIEELQICSYDNQSKCISTGNMALCLSSPVRSST